MKSIISPALAGIIVIAASAAAAAPPSIILKDKGEIVACAACHGADGAGNAQVGYPALAHLPAAYLVKQLNDFKAGTRSNEIMTRFAKALGAEEIGAVARYYAGLPRPKPRAGTEDPALIARGRELAVNGAWDRQVPPCFKCHAVDGTGIAPTFPPIAGQHAVYTVNQFKAWQIGTRNNDPQKLMGTVAKHLDETDVYAVAAYLATLGPQESKQ